MRIVSLNAWGGAMYDALESWLPTVDADVVCLQEMTMTPGVEGWTRFVDADRSLPQRANLFDDVAALLPHHQGTFLTSDSGPISDDRGEGRYRQDFGISTFVRKDVTLVGQHTAFVHVSHTDHDDWPTGGRPRLAQAVRVLDRATGRFVVVAHTHGLRDPAGKGDTPARVAQAEQLAELVQQAAQPGDLLVVCGDLNVLPDSVTFEILGRAGLTDLVGTADTRTSAYPKPVRHADYLLVSDPAAVEAFEILAEPEVSDHRPLVLDI
ncbi:endonuclease/exonuclease/phosphatase family protein [Euzebya rosea]|uniref:endonuclease/exonuclease/phosphatase family protein n=1 Tax=Euzebya rosea TaxID=2052804 RepID=UPI000D3E9BB6|nr:endonuclease/exonuclease/phosphatase family protein [Euzebya rosea]